MGESAERRGPLHAQRPPWLAKACSRFFEQQSTAGKERAYGAVGGPNYTIDDIQHSAAGADRVELFGVRDVIARHAEPKSLRVLDLGTGDGHILFTLHREFGIPWTNLVGVSAEDMRGMPEVLQVKEAAEDVNLRDIAEAEQSYIVWNIEDLEACPALADRKFDVIISWITFCWLTDPFGAIEIVHDNFLAHGGCLILGSLQLSLTGVATLDDQVYLAALRDRLRADGHAIDVLKDPVSRVFSWWFQRKVLDRLDLSPLLKYDALVEESLKVGYSTQLEAGQELEQFSPERLTVLS